MKKKLTIFFILICTLIVYVCFTNKPTERVLLVGKVIGFEIENYEYEEKNEKLLATANKELGTVTFIKEETNQFVALGHSLVDDNLTIQGKCYELDSIKIEKSEKNSIGQLNAYIKKDEQIGEILQNNSYGLFGIMDNIEKKNCREIETASRYQIRLGSAELLINLNGEKLESYEIEIVGINYLAKNRNIKIKVVDEELEKKTGGIVQGMSGTPIVQNGKLIGAINYVNIENPEEAYAIFVDKLL